MPIPLSDPKLKFMLLDCLHRFSWYPSPCSDLTKIPSGGFTVTYCWRCGYQRLHFCVSKFNLFVTGRRVPVVGLLCMYCLDNGLVEWGDYYERIRKSKPLIKEGDFCSPYDRFLKSFLDSLPPFPDIRDMSGCIVFDGCSICRANYESLSDYLEKRVLPIFPIDLYVFGD